MRGQYHQDDIGIIHSRILMVLPSSISMHAYDPYSPLLILNLGTQSISLLQSADIIINPRPRSSSRTSLT